MKTGLSKANTRDLSLLLLRLSVGVIILAHGSQKMLGLFGGHGFSQSFHVFTAVMGYPAILVLLAFISEFFGSLGIISGLFTRLSAFGVLCTMLTAMWSTLPGGFFMNWSGKAQPEGFEYFFPVIAILLILLINGPGGWSLDRFMPWVKKREAQAS